MKKLALALALAAVVLTVLLVLRFGFLSPRGVDVRAPAASTSALATSALDHPREEDRLAVEVADAAEVVGRGPPTDTLALEDAILGRVVHESGEPVANARLAAVWQMGGDFDFLDLAHGRREETVGEALSGSDGAFRMEVPPDRPLRVVAEAPGCSRAVLADIVAGAELLIVLGPSAALVGRVTRALDHNAVEGAELRLFRSGGLTLAEARSDADGSYRFPDAPPGMATLAVQHARLADSTLTALELVPGMQLVHDVVLEEGVTIHGRVTDASTGLPIADAEVGASWSFRRSVRTDGQGEYELHGFGGRGESDIHARAAGHADACHRYPHAALPIERTRLDFALAPARRLTGHVVDPGGAPAAGVYVAAVSGGGAGGIVDWKSCFTDASGRFLVDELTRTSQHALLLRADGWANLVYQVPDPLPGDVEVDLGRFSLQPGGALDGRVLDESSRPIAGAQVRLSGANADAGRLVGVDPPMLPDNLRVRSLRSDPSGRFHFGELAAGSWQLSAHHRDDHRSQSLGISLGESERRGGLELLLPRGLAITGRVLSPDGSGLTGTSVQALRKGATDERFSVRCAAGGQFEIGALRDAIYTLIIDPRLLGEVAGARFATTFIEGVQPADAPLRIVASLRSPVSGRVLTPEAKPAPGAWVRATWNGHAVDWQYADAQGRFELSVAEGSRIDLELMATEEADNSWGYTALVDGPRAELAGVRAGTIGLEIVLLAR